MDDKNGDGQSDNEDSIDRGEPVEVEAQRGTGRGARGAEAGPAKSGVDSVATGLDEGPDSGSILSTGGICRLLR